MRIPFTWANCSGGISIIVKALFSSAGHARRRRERRLQRFKFDREHVAHDLDMGNDVGAGDEAEIELVAVALHGDVERDPVGRDRHREDVQQFAPAAYSVCRGPGTLDTVMLADGGNTFDKSERL